MGIKKMPEYIPRMLLDYKAGVSVVKLSAMHHSKRSIIYYWLKKLAPELQAERAQAFRDRPNRNLSSWASIKADPQKLEKIRTSKRAYKRKITGRSNQPTLAG